MVKTSKGRKAATLDSVQVGGWIQLFTKYISWCDKH